MNKKTSLKMTLSLSNENYYTNEIDWQYMSVSQYKDFMKCEAAALSKLKGDWEPTSDPVALLVGNYVHSYFDSEEEHERFKEENKEKMFSSRKPYGLLKKFEMAEDMIQTMKNEPFFNFIYQGEKETIVTGELFETEWKAKIDCLNIEQGYFVDIKTSQDIHKTFYSEKYGYRVSFVEEYGYITQMAVYKKLLEQQYKKEFTPYIYAVTKQDPPDVAALKIAPMKLEFELDFVANTIQRVNEVKNGQVKPNRCNKCEYCRKTKELTGFIEVDELIR